MGSPTEGVRCGDVPATRVRHVVLAGLCLAATIAYIDRNPGSFLASIAGPCAYSITIDMGGGHVAPVFSTINMAGNLGAMLFPLAVPWFVRGAGWDSVLYLFAGIHLAAAICWLSLNPTGTVFDRVGAAGRDK